jgi:hypothetical protein
MQFEGKKGIALFVAIVAIACGIGFGSGLLVGRQFPAHSFQKFGQYLLDPTTGHVCDPSKDPKSDLFLKAIGREPTYPLACGK